MEIVVKNPANELSKPEIEQVQKKEHEYKLVGKFLRTRGLRLYSYNTSKGELKELEVSKKEIVHLFQDEISHEEVQVDTRNEQFEALNMRNAIKRVERWKDGKIKELCNLRKTPKEPMSFF